MTDVCLGRLRRQEACQARQNMHRQGRTQGQVFHSKTYQLCVLVAVTACQRQSCCLSRGENAVSADIFFCGGRHAVPKTFL